MISLNKTYTHGVIITFQLTEEQLLYLVYKKSIKSVEMCFRTYKIQAWTI
jgi:hypothetical protein